MILFNNNFSQEINKLKSLQRSLTFSRKKVLEKYESFKILENTFLHSRKLLEKSNIGTFTSELIESKYEKSKKEFIKFLNNEKNFQINLKDKLSNKLSKSSIQTFCCLFNNFFPEDEFNNLFVDLYKAHSQNKDSRTEEYFKNISTYRKHIFGKDVVYVKDNRVHYSDIILINDQNQILFLKRNKDDDFEPNKYCLPGGHVDEDENSKFSAKRELEEETGIKISINDIVEVGDYIDNKIYIHYYSAKFNGDPVVLEEREQIQYEWVDRDKVCDKDLLMNLRENLVELIHIPINKLNLNHENAENIFPSLNLSDEIFALKKGNSLQFFKNKMIEALEKGKAAQIGEIRTWAGVRMQKMVNGWIPVKGTTSTAKEEEESKFNRELSEDPNNKSEENEDSNEINVNMFSEKIPGFKKVFEKLGSVKDFNLKYKLALTKTYTGESYQFINRNLRELDNEFIKQYSDELCKFLDTLSTVENTVYRGEDHENPSAFFNELLFNQKKNGFIQFNQFTSTTTLKSVVEERFRGNLIYIIKSKSGKDISKYSSEPEESEVLLKPNTKFRILKRKKKSFKTPFGTKDFFEIELQEVL